MGIPQQTVSDTTTSKLRFPQRIWESVHSMRQGLRIRLLYSVLGIALISLLASIYVLFSFQRRQLIANARSSTSALSNLIEANLQHAMQTDDWDMVNDLIQTAASGSAIDALRVISIKGEVLASANRAEVGARFDPQAQLCQQCHQADIRPTSTVGEYDVASGRQVLFNMNLIQNGPACWNCHGPDQQVLGLMMIEVPLTLMNNQLVAGFWRTTIIALIACVLMVGLLVPVLNRYVIRPVEALSRGVDELAGGNLDHEVKASYEDELGKLAESFDQMRRQLRSSYLEISRREREATTLYELGTKISASLAESELLDSVADAARKLLNVDIGLVGLYDEAGQEIVIKAASGSQSEAHIGLRMPVCPDTPGGVLVEGLPVIAEAFDQDNLLRLNGSKAPQDRAVAILAVPLRLGDRFLGMIEVISGNRQQFTRAEAQLLMRLAHQVVVSIENAQLYQQLRYMATLEERDRLARELHDHLAQLLGYVNVRASMTDELLAKGRVADARESLAELKRAAKIAYTDVREEIFNLRTAVSPRVGLLPTLEKYLKDYHAHYGLDAQLCYDDEALTEFPSEIASQLLRIIQEALTNVRKHSNATQAWIRFAQERDLVCVLVEDNGQGFDTDQPTDQQQSYGLQIMRERAESVGGIFKLDSKPGHGTRVSVRFPIFSEN